MRQEMIKSSLIKRISDRNNLLLVLSLGALFYLFNFVSRPDTPAVPESVFPFLLLFTHMALAPIPWQWVESRAFWRKILLAMVFNVAWITMVLALSQTVGLDRPRHPPEGGPPMEGAPPAERPRPPMVPRAFFPNLGFGLINLVFAIAFGWTLAEKEATEAKERRTADLLRQSRSKALQNQLEPHVLYNALNSLSELVREDPLAAEEVITRLADLYRTLTVHGKEDLIHLGQERTLVEAYLSMEEMRLGDRLRVVWDWPTWADDILIPPLFLQPLVENAIKHGISPSDAGGEIYIACSSEGRESLLTIKNSGRPLSRDHGNGIGLENLKARMELCRGFSGTFSLESAGPWTVATIRWTPETSHE